MADYKETTISGKKWTRCVVVTIHNKRNAIPTIDFREQVVEIIDGKEKLSASGNIFCDFNPSNVIELVDPETLLPTGQTVLEYDVYLALFSRYLQAAKVRDEAGT